MKLYFYILDNDREFNPETRTFGDPVFKVRVEECEVIEKPNHWMQLFTRRIFHQRKSYESTGHDSGCICRCKIK